MTWIKRLVFAFGLALVPISSYSAFCDGRLYNPITDTNWMNLFPITIAGIPIGAGVNPPTLYEPPVCICPSRLGGIPSPGIGITYHEPLYLAEVTSKPGCLHTLGGIKILPGFEEMSGSGKGATDKTSGQGDRHQVHWYVYPLFEILDMFSDICMTSSNAFSYAYTTEIDPLWQDDMWGNVMTPEAALFANPIAHAACAVDAASSLVYFPIDSIFWCAGAWGNMYPLTGNPNSTSSQQQMNGLTLAKFLARQARIGALKTTVTPAALCYSFYNPVLVKTQFRVDPVFPVPHYGSPIYIGQPEVRWGYTPPMNYNTREESAYLLWNATQCCLRL